MIPDDDHGNPHNITTEKMRRAAKAGGNETIHKLMENLLVTYNEKVMGTPADVTPVTPDALYYREVYGREIQDINPNC
ncbi:MAG: hypothetical protein A2Z74_02085 [Chloroflexi bacterium RBG_13_46_9]|nr:MAG: hypothetical protein A2Z74_02085 [Chloroflexi bacterium RBG_13_46_9]